ncbi:MAG: 50S ribosomal protein L21, partial [Bacteroides sp.]|nr:50S ribosomal protein L21 [Bacteroides sp.]
MYAIVEIKGQQFKAEEGKYLYVHYLGEDAKQGDEVVFD